MVATIDPVTRAQHPILSGGPLDPEPLPEHLWDQWKLLLSHQASALYLYYLRCATGVLPQPSAQAVRARFGWHSSIFQRTHLELVHYGLIAYTPRKQQGRVVVYPLTHTLPTPVLVPSDVRRLSPRYRLVTMGTMGPGCPLCGCDCGKSGTKVNLAAVLRSSTRESTADTFTLVPKSHVPTPVEASWDRDQERETYTGGEEIVTSPSEERRAPRGNARQRPDGLSQHPRAQARRERVKGIVTSGKRLPTGMTTRAYQYFRTRFLAQTFAPYGGNERQDRGCSRRCSKRTVSARFSP